MSLCPFSWRVERIRLRSYRAGHAPWPGSPVRTTGSGALGRQFLQERREEGFARLPFGPGRAPTACLVGGPNHVERVGELLQEPGAKFLAGVGGEPAGDVTLDFREHWRDLITREATAKHPGILVRLDRASARAAQYDQAPETRLIGIAHGDDAVKSGAVVRLEHDAQPLRRAGGDDGDRAGIGAVARSGGDSGLRTIEPSGTLTNDLSNVLTVAHGH